jgi:hypothetical protein
MNPRPELEQIRLAAEAVSMALAGAGFPRDAVMIDSALATTGGDAQWLLAVREALVVTRPRWESIDDDARYEAARSLAAAKRLSIEL